MSGVCAMSATRTPLSPADNSARTTLCRRRRCLGSPLRYSSGMVSMTSSANASRRRRAATGMRLGCAAAGAGRRTLSLGRTLSWGRTLCLWRTLSFGRTLSRARTGRWGARCAPKLSSASVVYDSSPGAAYGSGGGAAARRRAARAKFSSAGASGHSTQNAFILIPYKNVAKLSLNVESAPWISPSWARFSWSAAVSSASIGSASSCKNVSGVSAWLCDRAASDANDPLEMRRIGVAVCFVPILARGNVLIDALLSKHAPRTFLTTMSSYIYFRGTLRV